MRKTAKSSLGLSVNTMEVLRKRYLLKDNKRRVIESPSALFQRVASSVAKAERNFGTKNDVEMAEKKFYSMMYNLEFLPNSPTLMNAGTPLGQLSACFVLPVRDSMEGIFKSLKNMARIHQTGGGTGFSFSDLRPKGDIVHSTKGEASGPVSFMSIYDAATGVIIQGGRRRGANMGILRCDHPDIIEFIRAKSGKRKFSNFNLSVGITDKFMDAVSKNLSFDLRNPRTGNRTAKVKAREVFNLIAEMAWCTGDPGLVFLDEINRKNPVSSIGRIDATNPCGELPLFSYESCNLGSINLSKMVKKNSINWQKLGENVKWAIRFLDNVIEVNRFPFAEVKKVTFANRKIGLGVMGFADMLIQLGIPYGTKRSIELGGKIMRFIRRESVAASSGLAKKRGIFPNFKKSIYAGKNLRMRNATINTIAPTGTISIIAGCSSGIEPLFAVSFVRNVLSGTKLFEVNSLFEKAVKERGIYNKRVLAEIARKGSLNSISGIPGDLKRIFVTAFDITAKEHLWTQAAFQKYTDNAVSKTINLPPEATVDDVKKIYRMAYKIKCKGITVYRYGTKKKQVLSFYYGKKRYVAGKKALLTTTAEYAGGCMTRLCPF